MTNVTYKLAIDDVIRCIENARIKRSEHHIVKIVAISKYSTSQEIEKLYTIGQRAFGENKVQDLKHKTQELKELPLEWHFVGSLQKNKLNNLIDLAPSLLQSLDSLELAQELQKKLFIKNKTMNALLQINSSFEQTKHGFSPENTLEMYEKITQECPNIKLKGLMSIAPKSEDKEKIKKSFKLTHSLFTQLKDASICSMGMSGDFELAIECGSNMLRLGSIMFPKK